MTTHEIEEWDIIQVMKEKKKRVDNIELGPMVVVSAILVAVVAIGITGVVYVVGKITGIF